MIRIPPDSPDRDPRVEQLPLNKEWIKKQYDVVIDCRDSWMTVISISEVGSCYVTTATGCFIQRVWAKDAEEAKYLGLIEAYRDKLGQVERQNNELKETIKKHEKKLPKHNCNDTKHFGFIRGWFKK